MSIIIQATNIHRSFGKEDLATHVLKGIDLSVEEGEFISIIGKSGAGKSTLMYQLSVLDEPNEGTIVIAGTDVGKLKEYEQTSFRLNTLGYIFQNYALVPDLTAGENVMLPLLMRGYEWQRAKKTAQDALTNVELSTKFNSIPAELSGGEQQRVAIARAVAGKPKIIFADEPTANLDSVSGQVVMDFITKLHKEHNQTIVMVTHDYDYTSDCDRIITLSDGKIVKEQKNRKNKKRK